MQRQALCQRQAFCPRLLAAADPLPGAAAAPDKPRYDPRTRALIEGAIAPTLIRLERTEYARHVRAVLRRTCGDLFHRQARHRSIGRRRARVSAADADADDVGRRHGRRHVIRDRARARRRQAQRRRCLGAACARYRHSVRPRFHVRAADRRAMAVYGHGRQRRVRSTRR